MYIIQELYTCFNYLSHLKVSTETVWKNDFIDDYYSFFQKC